MPRAFEYVQKAGDVCIDVGLRILQRVSDARLRGEMHDAIGTLALEDVPESALIGIVDCFVLKPVATNQSGKARSLQRDIVVVVQIVDADNRVAAREQLRRDVRADESGASGDEHLHVDGSESSGGALFREQVLDVEDHALRFAELTDRVDSHLRETGHEQRR